MPIISRTPTRVDLAGGTLDIWPIYLLMENAVTINAAISVYASARLEPLDDDRIELFSIDQQTELHAESLSYLPKDSSLPLITRLVHHFAPTRGFRLDLNSTAPAGSGLGGSSSLAIAIAGALNEFTGKRYNQEELIGVARDVEAQVIRIPTGEQDYYAAMYGGIHAWHFEVERVKLESYTLPIQELEDRILLFYSGLPRASGINNWQVFKSCIDGDASVIASLRMIQEQAIRLHAGLKETNWKEVFGAIDQEWLARKELAPSITTPEIEEIIAFGKANGAHAGKVCGAGGGGCLILVTDPDNKAELARRAIEKNYRLLEFQLTGEGLHIATE